jgi:hypothetical protein
MLRRVAVLGLVALAACRSRGEEPAPAPVPSVAPPASASVTRWPAPPSSESVVDTAPPTSQPPLLPPRIKLAPYVPKADACKTSEAWDEIRPLRDDLLGKSREERLFELKKGGAPAGYAYVHRPSDDASCAPAECVVLGSRVASIDGPIADVGDKPIDTKGTRAEAWDAPQGPCNYQLSVLAVRDASGATRAAMIDYARMKARRPEAVAIFEQGAAVAWRTIDDGMDPWGGITDTDVWALEDGAMRRVLHVQNANHTCWGNDDKDRVCKRAIFGVRVIEPGKAPFIELASEVGVQIDREANLVNVEVGRYRWDDKSRRFKREGKLRHEVRTAEIVPYAKRLD